MSAARPCIREATLTDLYERIGQLEASIDQRLDRLEANQRLIIGQLRAALRVSALLPAVWGRDEGDGA